MADPNADLTAAGVEPRVEQPQRTSPASAVCYLDLDEAQDPRAHAAAPARTVESTHTRREGHEDPAAREGEGGDEEEGEEDNTPRSEVPATAAAGLQQTQSADAGPGYFSPQPLRPYSSKLPTADPSPTPSLNASTTSVHLVETNTQRPPSPSEHSDRPGVQRDLSSTSTASVTTVRASSVDPFHALTPPSKLQRDGPHYPNQSYAALQFQQHPTYTSHPLRTRSSHPAHFSTQSVSHISTFGHPSELHREMMESGSRTVGNSPASSPGLFSPATPPLRHTQLPEDINYSALWLHPSQRQAPKETHIADVDIDPISGRKIINQYEVIQELGRGVHGKVKKGRDLVTNNEVAIKIVDRFAKRKRLGKSAASLEDKINKEIAILKKARHPNIVSLLEVIDDPKWRKVYIVLELVELGEVKWRIEAAKEVAQVEWRRYQRESDGVFDDDREALEDEKIIKLAHEKLERQRRRRAKAMHRRRLNETENEAWSFETGADSDSGEEFSESLRSRSSTTMVTAYRSTTPVASSRAGGPDDSTGLEGTMYGAYDTPLFRDRTPSLAGSSSSHFTDGEEEVPEHFRYVPLLTIQAARETFRDTVLGLEYLHYQGIIHRDIKPANLLQTSEHRIKISDFGVSYLGRRASEDSAGEQSESEVVDYDDAIELAKTVGTPAFYAPELCRTDVDADTPAVDFKIDVWALGVTLYCLIYGRVPFFSYNTFHLMKLITDTEPYIPKYRLKAVAEPSGSRPSSHGRMYHSVASNKRAPHDLEYEEVDEDLRNLLKSLLVKDPKHRISIIDIKRHPWLLRGIDDSNSWVEQTDPGRSFHGRKIQVSKDDVDKAVIPITLIDRVRSGLRKTLDAVVRVGTRGGSRRRAQSTTTGQEPPPSLSTNSSSSTISQEGRRPSLVMSQHIFEALGRSREPDHPLSQSVTASPEARERSRFFESPTSRTSSPAHSNESHEYLSPLTTSSRPLPLERAYSAISSSAASVRTIRQSDMPRSGGPMSPIIPPALPGTPTALESPGGSNLGGIFGGVPHRFIHNMRSRDRMLKPPRGHHRAKSIDRLVSTDDDAHSEPSIALSTTSAVGHVPDLLMEMSSPTLSDLYSPDPIERVSSRHSSISSASSRAHKTLATHNELEIGPALDINTTSPPPLARETSDDRFSRAKDEFIRRRVREENQGRDRPHSATFQRPVSALSQTECPPSPDDEVFLQRQKIEEFLNQQHPPSLDTSPVSYPIDMDHAQPRGLTASSSEDHFTSMSQSTSHPSIPSVVSANSSIAPEDCFPINPPFGMMTATSADSIFTNQFDSPSDDPAGYDGDHPLESDDDDSDEEDFIIMGKRKPAPALARSGSISNAELARSSIKDITSHRRRSARSGSNGTVKKIKPIVDSDNEKTPEAA
ncbi:kinase-like protein [Melanomma pulvis-pyrius CBS 109.77]|uniref:non-specific serine/threonine protein kinase n=1 Tax=Melanomma pulvis-pyrius CBS 109.77 TaxID=1314802 RepID=A0A6A6WW34_9PLEO|nr:kinase-like protein [Melanomma pulvis-pyrius CBS 109.77]